MKVLPAEMVISKRQVIWGFHRWIVRRWIVRWRQNGNLRHQTATELRHPEESRGIRSSPVVLTVGGVYIPFQGFKHFQVLQDFNPNHPIRYHYRICSGTFSSVVGLQFFSLPWCKLTNINVDKPMEKPWFLCGKIMISTWCFFPPNPTDRRLKSKIFHVNYNIVLS